MSIANGKRFYGPDDLTGVDYETQLGNPGEYPFTRGRRATGQPGGSWILRELSGEGPPSSSNRQFRELIETGATGLDVIGDAPTVGWIDPDHPFARAAVGTQGVSLCRLQDFHELYEGIPIDKMTLSHSTPPWFSLAGLFEVAKARGIDPAALRGSVIQAPMFAEDYCYAVNMPVELRLRLTLDSMEFAAEHMPKFHSFVEDTYFVSDGGPDAVDEMAFGFIEIRTIVRALVERGVDVDRFAPRIAILVNCRMGFFEEIAKIRATRRLYARMMKEEFGAKDPRSWSAPITAHTAGSALTAQQPVNNIVRGTVQALSLALAGVQAMEISTFDEAFRTPSREAHRVAIRTQQIIQMETDVGAVTDPLGGSYYVESLTNEMERRIEERVREIEAVGEPVALCRDGWFRGILVDAMTRNAREIQDGTVKRVGVNVLQIPDEEDVMLREAAEGKIDPCWDHVERIREWKRARDLKRLAAALRTLHAASEDRSANLMPAILAALEHDATLGEMSGAMRMAYDMPYDPLARTEAPFAEVAP